METTPSFSPFSRATPLSHPHWVLLHRQPNVGSAHTQSWAVPFTCSLKDGLTGSQPHAVTNVYLGNSLTNNASLSMPTGSSATPLQEGQSRNTAPPNELSCPTLPIFSPFLLIDLIEREVCCSTHSCVHWSLPAHIPTRDGTRNQGTSGHSNQPS